MGLTGREETLCPQLPYADPETGSFAPHYPALVSTRPPRAKLPEKLDYEVLGWGQWLPGCFHREVRLLRQPGSRAEPRPSEGLDVVIAAAWGQHSAPSTRQYLLHPGRHLRLEPPSPRWQHPPKRGRTTAGVEIIERPKIGAGSHAGPRSASDTSLRNSSVILAMVLG